MSILPTTRINSLVSTSIGGADHGIPGQDEDILLVDFQPIVVPNNQILSSPSTTNSTAMYPIQPPTTGHFPGAHVTSSNANHHPSVSSDGITTPISATGSGSGKIHNPNNFSLVNLSNHLTHHNNTSREESDLNYHHSHPPLINTATAVTQANLPYDENDEFARHQAMAQPSYVTNKRRSRRFVSKDNHIMWDNTNHVGHHQPHVSSSLSSSEDSDTGFLMGTRKTAYTRRSVQRVVDPHPTTGTVGGGNGSPSATTGLLPNIGNRKRVRRRRPSARNRKPANNQRDKMPNAGDMLSFCCCLCDDDQPSHSNRSSSSSSIKSRYFRWTCFIIMVILVILLTSITVSLQRKVDTLDLSLRKLDQAVGSPLAADSTTGANINVRKSEPFDNLLLAHNELNATVSSFKTQLEQVLNKLQDLQKQINTAIASTGGVEEVRGDLAKLGSRVQELSATLDKVQENMEQLKVATQNANNININHTASESTNQTVTK